MFNDNSSRCKAELERTILKWLDACGEMAVNNIKPLVKVDTGELRASINYKVVEGEKTCYVGTPLKRGIYLEFGTGVHAENGSGRKGGWTYKDPKTGKRVFTFGSKAYPFMRPGLRKAKPIAIRLAKQYAQELGGK